MDAAQVSHFEGQIKKLTQDLLAMGSQLKSSTETVEALKGQVDDS